MPTEFAINALNYKTVAALLLIGVLPLLLVGLTIHFLGGGKGPQVAVFGVVGLAIAIALLGVWQLNSIRLTVDAQTLAVGGGAYRVSIPMAQVDRGAVRLRAGDKDHALGMRTNGIGMPGLALGWFNAKNSKVFAAVTDPEKVVIIPTTAGYTILASPEDPAAFLEAIHAR